MFKRVLNTNFDWAWWIGFIGAIVLVFITKMGIIDGDNSWIILAYGIIHMAILTILGLYAIDNGKSNMDIGHRISTMGYLHTLIGTSVALILASNADLYTSADTKEILKQMNSIILPIGSALITSIIGWAVGTEIERSIHGTKEETIVDHALQNLVNTIENLAKKLEKSTDIWTKGINETTKTLSTTTKKSFDELFDEMGKQINTIQGKFDNSSNNATTVMSNLMIAFEAIFKRMESQAKEIEKNFQSSNSQATQVLEDLSLSYQNLMTQTQDNVDSLNKTLKGSTANADESINNFTTSFNGLFNTMQTYSDTMQEDFKTSSNNAKKIMDKLSLSFTNVFGQIDIISTEWETHIKNMKEFSIDSSTSLKGLLNDSKKVAREIQLVADGIPNSAQVLREVDEILEVIRAIKESD